MSKPTATIVTSTAAPTMAKNRPRRLREGSGVTVPAMDSLRKLYTRASRQMPHRAVAAQAGNLPAARRRMRRFDRVDNFLVTIAAGVLGDLAAVRPDLNVVGVAAGGEK